jgi:hypothetical protein
LGTLSSATERKLILFIFWQSDLKDFEMYNYLEPFKSKNFVLAEEMSQTWICNEQIGEVKVYLTVYKSKVCIKRLVSPALMVS